MSHIQRKSYVLPCRRTVGESWGALRRSWLGFKIAVGKGDRALMKHYASFIVRVQVEMGIPITKFDSDLLDAQAAKLVYDNGLVQGNDGSIGIQENTDRDSAVREREMDYDGLLNADLMEQDNQPRQFTPPRSSVFTKFESRIENSCPQSGRYRINKHTVNYKYCCPVGPVESPPDHTSIAIEMKVEHDHDKSCYVKIDRQADHELPSYSELHDGYYGRTEEEQEQEEEGEEELIQSGTEVDAEMEVDDNQDDNEPSEWAHVSDFQTTETTDSDHILHEDNSCPYQVDDNQDDNEPSEWAHVSDFQTTETTDSDHIVHEDNSCPFQETVKRNRSCPYKYDDD